MVSSGEFAEPIEQLAQGVPGNDRLAVRLGDTGLPGAEPAVADDYVRMLLAEPTEPQYLVRLVRRDPRGGAAVLAPDGISAGVAGRRLVGAAKGIGAIASRLKMADRCVYGIYRLREGRHSGDSRPDIADEVHDAGTVGVFLLKSILDGLGICQGRV